MDDINPKELSQKEKDSLDKQMSRLEPKIVDAKHKYEDLVSQYSELFGRNASRKNCSKHTRTVTDLWIRYCHLWLARNGMNNDHKHLV